MLTGIGRKRDQGTLTQAVDFGKAELVPDPDRPGAWTLVLDGVPQSYVDTSDPAQLRFDYMRWLAWVADAAASPGQPVDLLHLGGGALSLPRYFAATRPGSRQVVIEHDAALMELIRRVLPWPKRSGIRVRIGDAVELIQSLDARFHVVLSDMPPVVSAVRHLLGPDGLYARNLIDGGRLDLVRAEVAQLRSVFARVCLIGEPAVLRGRRPGNVVIAAGDNLPLDTLATAAAREALPVRLIT